MSSSSKFCPGLQKFWSCHRPLVELPQFSFQQACHSHRGVTNHSKLYSSFVIWSMSHDLREIFSKSWKIKKHAMNRVSVWSSPDIVRLPHQCHKRMIMFTRTTAKNEWVNLIYKVQICGQIWKRLYDDSWDSGASSSSSESLLNMADFTSWSQTGEFCIKYQKGYFSTRNSI
jgi:hypothetical protein